MSRWSVTSTREPDRFIHWVDGSWTADEETTYCLNEPGFEYPLCANGPLHPLLDETDIHWAAVDMIPDPVQTGDFPKPRGVESIPGVIY